MRGAEEFMAFLRETALIRGRDFALEVARLTIAGLDDAEREELAFQLGQLLQPCEHEAPS